MSQLEFICFIIFLIIFSPAIILGLLSMCLEEYKWVIKSIIEIKEYKK